MPLALTEKIAEVLSEKRRLPEIMISEKDEFLRNLYKSEYDEASALLNKLEEAWNESPRSLFGPIGTIIPQMLPSSL